MTRREMQDAITMLKRDLAETMLELGNVRSRVWDLETAREVDKHAARQPKAPLPQAGCGDGLGRGHE